MAYDRLEPVRALILRLQSEGRTLTDIADELSRSKGIETTPATVSRYLKSIGNAQSARELTPVEAAQLDTAAVLVELLAEVRGRGDEQRAAIEALAGKVAVVCAQTQELEKRIATFSRSPVAKAEMTFKRTSARYILVAMVIVLATASAFLIRG